MAALFLALTVCLAGCGGGDGGTTTVVAPTITTQPTSRTVLAGESTTLTVSATGNDLQYQWYFEGTAKAGATGSSLTISNATASNAGSYYVVVSNSAGSVTSNTVTLSVNADTGDGDVIVQ